MVKIVVGNESCDIDSFVCSYVLATILNIHFSIKIPFALFKLKKELQFLVENFEFDMTRFCKKFSPTDELYLVDHNRSDGNTILGVVDHHVREISYDGLEFNYVERAGSCASLLFKYFTIPKNLYPLIYIAVAVDTAMGTDIHKTTDLDREVLEKTKFNFDITKLFDLKQDYTDLSPTEIFSLDYKEIDQYGISVIYNTDFSLEDMEEFKKEKKIDKFFLMILDENSRYIVSTDLPSDFLNFIKESSFTKNKLEYVKHSQKITRKNIIGILKKFHGRRSDC